MVILLKGSIKIQNEVGQVCRTLRCAAHLARRLVRVLHSCLFVTCAIYGAPELYWDVMIVVR